MSQQKPNPERAIRFSPTLESSGKNYLLVIAIDEYTHCPPLYNAVRDAQDFVNVLTQKYQFESEQVVKIFNAAATRPNILRQFRELSRRIEPQDNLIVYYSGHGLFDEHFDHGYWAPVDAKLDPDDMSGFVGNDDLIRFIKATKSKHTFLIVDSCFSGALFARIRLAGVARLESKPSRWALTSGRKEPVQDGRPGMNSPFSQYLLSYLRDNAKPKLLVSELVQYVKTAVANNAEQIPIGNPLQNVGDEGGEFAFHLKDEEEEAWIVCSRENTIPALQLFLQLFPKGRYRGEAERRVAQLRASQRQEIQLKEKKQKDKAENIRPAVKPPIAGKMEKPTEPNKKRKRWSYIFYGIGVLIACLLSLAIILPNLNDHPPKVEKAITEDGDLTVAFSDGTPPYQIKFFKPQASKAMYNKLVFKSGEHKIDLADSPLGTGDYILQVLGSNGQKSPDKLVKIRNYAKGK